MSSKDPVSRFVKEELVTISPDNAAPESIFGRQQDYVQGLFAGCTWFVLLSVNMTKHSRAA